jgi:ABC-type sugar transport system ATPase subunit
VRGVDLDIPEGEFAVLAGSSECGKSTWLRASAIVGEVSNEMRPRDRNVGTERLPRQLSGGQRVAVGRAIAANQPGSGSSAGSHSAFIRAQTEVGESRHE